MRHTILTLAYTLFILGSWGIAEGQLTRASDYPGRVGQGFYENEVVSYPGIVLSTKHRPNHRGETAAGLDDTVLQYEGGALWTPLRTFQIQDNLMYTGYMNGFKVIDVSHPDSMSELRQVYTGELVNNIVVQDTVLLVAQYYDGLSIYSVSDPLIPRILGRYECPHCRDCGLAMKGDTAFIGTNSGLEIVDVSNAQNPQLLTLVELDVHTRGPVSRVLIDDTIMYVAAAFTMIYDISDITNPILLSEIGDYEEDYALAYDFALRDSVLFVSRKSAWYPSISSTLSVLDVVDPSAPRVIFDTSFVGYTYEIELLGQYLLLGTEASGLLVYEVSDPADLILVDCLYALEEGYSVPYIDYVERLSVVDDKIYIANRAPDAFDDCCHTPISLCADDSVTWADSATARSDLVGGDFVVAGLSDSGTIIVDGVLEGHPYPITVDISGNTGAVGMAWGNLALVDVSDPTNIELLSQIKPPAYANDVSVNGDRVYLANSWDGLRVVDISDPTNPVLSGHLPTDSLGQSRSVEAVDSYVLHGSDNGVLTSIYVPTPDSARIVWRFETGGGHIQTTILGNYAYVADNSYTLFIFEITDLAAPQLVGTFEEVTTPRRFWSLAGDGSRLYNLMPDRVLIYSVEDQINPQLLGEYIPANPPNCISAEGTDLFIGTLYETVEYVDVSNPAVPMLVSEFTNPRYSVSGLDTEDGFVYGVDSYSLFALRPDQITGVEDPVSDLPLPSRPTLSANYPNPFNPSTVIPFSLHRSQHVRLEVLNVLGQYVTTLIEGELVAGHHEVEWDGTCSDGSVAASGVYFYRIVAESTAETRKMLLLK